jgi:hypothetical protein
MPFLFGKITTLTGYSSLVFFLGIFLLLMTFLTKALNRKISEELPSKKY